MVDRLNVHEDSTPEDNPQVEDVQEVAQEEVQDVSQDASQENSQEEVQDISEDASQEISQEVAQDVAQEEVQEAVQEAVQDVAQEVDQEVAQDVSEEIIQEEVQEETSMQEIENPLAEQDEVSQQEQDVQDESICQDESCQTEESHLRTEKEEHDVSQDVSQDISQDVVDEVVEDVVDEVVDEIVDEAQDNIVDKIIEQPLQTHRADSIAPSQILTNLQEIITPVVENFDITPRVEDSQVLKINLDDIEIGELSALTQSPHEVFLDESKISRELRTLSKHIDQELEKSGTYIPPIDLSKLTSKSSSTNASTHTSKQASKQASKQVSKPSSTQVSSSVSTQASKVMSKSPSTHASKHTSKSPSTQVSNPVSKPVSKPVSTQVSKPSSTNVSRSLSQAVSQIASKQVSKSSTPTTSKPASQPTSTHASRSNSVSNSVSNSRSNSRSNSNPTSPRPQSRLGHRSGSQTPLDGTLDGQEVELSVVREESNEGDVVINVDEQKQEEVVTTRNRKTDRRILAADLSSELPIAFRYSENVNIDNEESLPNYSDDWRQWLSSGQDQLEILLEQVYIDEQKYKKLSSRNGGIARLIQFGLLVIGSSIVYVQASQASAEVIQKFNIASGGLTTVCSSLLSFCGFSDKASHYNVVKTNLQRLRSWIESKLVLPEHKRFSPYDIFIISKRAYDAIILEASEGLKEKSS